MKFWQHSKITWLGLLVGALALMPQVSLAAADCADDYGEASLTFEYVVGPDDAYELEQPFGGTTSVTSIGEYVQLVYEFAVGLVSIIAVVLIMIGGVRWIAAAGNESAITEAKEMITSAVMGLIIAVLSYTLLLFINPQLTEIETSIAKIPVPLACGTPEPTVESVPTIDGLKGNGSQLCPNAITELQRLATAMRTECSNCTIVVNNGYRTHEAQADLYSCYVRSKAEFKKTDGSQCVSGCSSCNVAAAPCCGNHEDGKAVDLYLEGSNYGLASSAGYLAGYHNNGDDGGNISAGAVGGNCNGTKNPDLCLNQQALRRFMTVTGSKFSGIPIEWWHFDYHGSCSDAGSTCTPVNGKANNTYCKANGESIYKLADCNGSAATCPASDGKTWAIVEGSCPTDQHYTFASGATAVSGVTGGYSGLPGCVAN